jgi:hypothetical protein
MLANSFLLVLSAFFALLCVRVALSRKKRLEAVFALFAKSHKNQRKVRFPLVLL